MKILFKIENDSHDPEISFFMMTSHPTAACDASTDLLLQVYNKHYRHVKTQKICEPEK